MVENSLLAIAAALMLGTKEEQIAAVAETFAPLPMRGMTVKAGNSSYYADCYNASPTSMKDALAHFIKISGNSAPRLFVLGSMAELGLATHRHHKEIGYNLPYREGDKAILVGENAQIYKLGMTENQWPESAIEVFENAESAKGSVAAFEGSVFIKGSRVCELEKLLPDEVVNLLSENKQDAQTEADKIQAQQESDAPGGIEEREEEPPEEDSDEEFSEDGEEEDEVGDEDEDSGEGDEDSIEDGAEDDEDERETI